MESRFLRIRCPRCRATHIIFGKASTRVKCRICNAPLVHNKGGKAKIRAQIDKIL